MRTALLMVALAAGARIAHAEPRFEPKHEPPLPPKVQEIAHKLFDEAAAATADGKLPLAVSKYRELQRLSPHPNIDFNLALIFEAQDNLSEAIAAYDAYVAAVPPAESAKVAKHLEELRAMPGHVDAEVRTKYDTKALWFVDGVLTARDDATFDVPPGKHKFDLVTEIGYAHALERIGPGHGGRDTRDNRISLSADERTDGNLILSSGPSDHWGWFYAVDGSDRDDALGKGVHHGGRYQIAHGKHAIQVKDEVCDYDTSIDVRAGELTYVLFDRDGFDEKALLKDRTEPRRRSKFCGTLIVRRTVVHFDAKLPPHPFRGKRSD